MGLPKLDENRIKKLVVEQNNTDKFFAKLPKGFNVNDKSNQKLLKKWSSITEDDISMEEVEYSEKYNVNVYTFNIHEFFRFGFVEREDGTIDVQQLSFIEN
ncbi:hypothetical protein [Mammaliicoccus sciuri]|uniref:hypothetical protein n=1 Tax=Mammaliicoccus sciuri TaxID=1296 RepID=UPI002B25F4AA|nr:hypothetical protein [Mammaliicoccus sciuri]WQK75279.1 hypothetical protein P3U33_05975 [Mammaliicoccus sciuri]